ncbi:MAG: integrase [Methanoculleus sp. SDB]|nr:MAG: integrase [Methanoculleus sp. SDB]
MEGDYFSEWLPRFSHHLRMRNYSPRTVRSYEEAIRRFAQYLWLRRNAQPDRLVIYWKDLATARIDTDVDATHLLITDYLSFLASMRTYKPTTLHRVISTLSSFYRYLYAQGVVVANPLAAVDRPRIKEQELVYLKHSQVIKLIESIPDLRDRLIFRTIYATGVRVSELCGIDIGDIDFEDHTIRVRGKGGKIRIVFVDEDTLAGIRVMVAGRVTGPLFEGQQGHPLSPRTVQHIFRKYAPPGVTPHKIRHSYASELYRRSRNLRVVQENLGHSSIRTTEIYLHTDLDERKEVYRRYFPLSNGE